VTINHLFFFFGCSDADTKNELKGVAEEDALRKMVKLFLFICAFY